MPTLQTEILAHPRLLALLDQLESAIDPATEDALERAWLGFTFDRRTLFPDLFLPSRGGPRALDFPTPPFINETLPATVEGYARMLIGQYTNCLYALRGGGGAPMVVRANYGTGILPSVLGCGIYVMPPESDTLPTVTPLGGAGVEALLERDVPPLTNGYGGQAFVIGELIREIAARYPKIGRYVHVAHPDLQGPIDDADLIWGSDLFFAVYDRPELVHALLGRICETYIRFMAEWGKLFPAGEYGFHGGMMYRGALMLRNDSAMNFSAEMFAEFIQPYDQLLLERCGGGAMHFCGRGDHYIAALCRTPNLYAVNVSQPELNDMETIFCHTVDRGIKLISLERKFALAHRQRLGRMAQA